MYFSVLAVILLMRALPSGVWSKAAMMRALHSSECVIVAFCDPCVRMRWHCRQPFV